MDLKFKSGILLVVCIFEVYLQVKAEERGVLRLQAVISNKTTISGWIQMSHVLNSSDWKWICLPEWHLEDANVACHQMHFGNAVLAYTVLTQFPTNSTFWVFQENFKCNGTENSLNNCQSHITQPIVAMTCLQGVAALACTYKESSASNYGLIIGVPVACVILLIASGLGLWKYRQMRSGPYATLINSSTS